MEHLEGKQSVLAAMRARRRRIDVLLVAHDAHEEKIGEVLAAAAETGVPIKRVSRADLDGMAHGGSHGGLIAVASPKPRTTIGELMDLVDQAETPVTLLLIEGIDDARNLGFTLRTAEATGAAAVLVKKHLWDFDPIEVSRPSSGAYERMPLVQIEDVAPLKELQRRGLRLYGCVANAKRTLYDRNLSRPVILAIGG